MLVMYSTEASDISMILSLCHFNLLSGVRGCRSAKTLFGLVLRFCIAPQNTEKSFSELRQEVAKQWTALPKVADVISEPLKQKISAVRRGRQL